MGIQGFGVSDDGLVIALTVWEPWDNLELVLLY